MATTFQKKLIDLFNAQSIATFTEYGEIEFTDKPIGEPDTLIVASSYGDSQSSYQKSYSFDENQMVEVDEDGNCTAITLDNQEVGFNFSMLIPIQATDFPDDNGLSQKPISINRKHFIGNGLIPFQVTGRVIGDDEDVSCLILADNIVEAQESFCTLVLEEARESMDAKSVLITEILMLD